MALHDILLEEHIGLWEDIQGNVNVAGMVFEEELVSTLFTDDPVSIVWVEQVEDGFEITPDFTPSHEPYCFLSEGLLIQEGVGVPAEIYSSEIKAVYAREVGPVQIWWMGLNVVHGPDTFFEEVVSGLHATEPVVQAVPYHWEYAYESLGLEFHNIEPLPGITLSRNMLVNDIVNMRQEINFDYVFVVSALEQLFIFEQHTWGWKQEMEEEVDFLCQANRALGWVADEHIHARVDDVANVKAQHLAHTEIFTWDRVKDGKTFRDTLATSLECLDASAVGLELVLEEPLKMIVSAGVNVEVYSLAADRLAAKDRTAPCWEMQVQESFALADSLGLLLEIYGMCGESVGITPQALEAMGLILDIDESLDLGEGVN